MVFWGVSSRFHPLATGNATRGVLVVRGTGVMVNTRDVLTCEG